MPPVDYSPYKKVVPSGGVASLTPEEQAYLDQQRAAAEPWSSYIPRVAGDIGNNLYNTVANASLWGMAKGAVEGASDAATLPGDALTGKQTVINPDGTPNQQAIERSFNAAGMVTLGSGAVPAEAAGAELRSGMKFPKVKADDIELKHTTMGEARKLGAVTQYYHDELPDEAPIALWRANPSRINNVSGKWRALPEAPKNKKELLYDLKVYYHDFMEDQINEGDMDMRKDDLHRLFGKRQERPTDPEQAAFLDRWAEDRLDALQQARKKYQDVVTFTGADSPEGRKALQEIEAIDGAMENYLQQGYKPIGPKPKGGTQLNMGLAGLWDRIVRSPEGGGGGYPTKLPHPKNPEGSVRQAEIRSGGMYSKAEEVIQNWNQKEGTFEQFTAYLKKSGVKQPEIDALTKNYNPGDRVNKKQLINTLMAEEPEIKVVETNHFGDDGHNMPGGTNYRMMNITWGNPNATYGMHPYKYTPHNLPDNTLVHARLKDDVYTGADGIAKKVLRVEELQSDWAQQGEGKFALPVSADRVNVRTVPLDQVEELLVQSKKKEIAEKPELEPAYRKLGKALANSAAKEGHDTFSFYRVSGVKSTEWQAAGAGKRTPEEILEDMRDFEQELNDSGTMAEPMDPVQEMQYNARFGQDPAPYVSQGSPGVLQLATKRLLVEAAQNGQDEIVFAPGVVHANRWGSGDSKRAEGLKTYYDKILPNEVGKVLKDLEKESGIKGVKLEVEERPFVDHGAAGGAYTPQREAHLWFNKVWGDTGEQQRRGLNPPTMPDQANYTTENMLQYFKDHQKFKDDYARYDTKMNNIASQFQTIRFYTDKGMSVDQAVAEAGQTLKDLISTDDYLVKSYTDQLNELENKPYNQLTRTDELKMHEAQQQLDKFSQYRLEREQKLEDLQDAHKLYKYWDENVHAKGGTQAYVIKLTPDLRDYIKKNGLPRFAKGGIVDVVLHGAAA